MKKAVVIGAGQSGRGYVARYLFEKNYEITFIDKSDELIQLMQEDHAFTIHFYRKDRTPLYIQGFKAYESYCDGAKNAIHEADFIFTAVGEQNLSDVAKQLKEGLLNKAKETILFACENGVNPGKVLKEAMQKEEIMAPFRVSQSAIFCSTVSLEGTRLDILSMNETFFPYDCDGYDGELDFDGAVPMHDFEKYFKRKIYTYNCLAGLISYCGYVKGYEVYGDAANDPDISEMMDKLLEDLNPVLQEYFEITKEDQEAFADKAMVKMKDKSILDFNIKNGRAPQRKLGPTERIMTPLNILKEHHIDPKIMEFVAASALIYWEELQGTSSASKLTATPIEALCELNKLSLDDPTVVNIQTYVDEIKANRDHVMIMDILYGKD